MGCRYFLSFAFVIILAACSPGTVKDTLGLTHDAPDEYRVVSRPPLSVPPQFNLRPPAAPGETPPAQATDLQAKALITGKPLEASDTFRLQPANAPITPTSTARPTANSSPEARFLERAGADAANPNIRSAIEQDKLAARRIPEEEKSWWDVLSVFPDKKDPVVAAKEEAERLKKNQEEGKPVTEGETPEAKTKDTGILGTIFGY